VWRDGGRRQGLGNTGCRRRGIWGILSGVLWSISIPIDHLKHGLASVHLCLQDVLVGIEQRSRNVVIAELVVGVGWNMANIEGGVTVRVIVSWGHAGV